jgi:NAD-dependent DNA ligase
MLSSNPNAIHLLFYLDKPKMLENMKGFCEELVQAVFNPKRAQRMADLYKLDMVEYLELL